MNYEIKQLFKSAEGRYFTELEMQKLIGYATSLRRRLEVADDVERVENEIIGTSTRATMERFPELAVRHGEQTAARIQRDQTLVLRYAVFAMIQRDPDFMRDKLSIWLASILDALCDLEPVIEGMKHTIDACREHLSPEHFEELCPYLELNLRVFEARQRAAA